MANEILERKTKNIFVLLWQRKCSCYMKVKHSFFKIECFMILFQPTNFRPTKIRPTIN